jgi:hypothetical protein
VIADFDGDRDLEVVASVRSPAALSLLRNLGDGTFAAPELSPLNAGTDPVGLVARDFTGDGRVDVLVAQSGTDTLKLMRNLVDGTFVPGDLVAERGGSAARGRARSRPRSSRPDGPRSRPNGRASGRGRAR